MIQIQAQLSGFAPKKGSGTLEDGTPWTSDRVELYCLTPLDETKGSKGFATTTYKIQGCDNHKELASSLVGKPIVLNCEMKTNGRGGPAQIQPVSFSAVK